MSADALEALLAGGVCGGGVLLLITALVGRPPAVESRPPLFSQVQLSRL